MKLFVILYNLSYLLLYLPVLILGYIPALLTGNAANWNERFGLFLPDTEESTPSLWFHAASVGEVKSLAFTVNVLRQKYKGHRILVSTMTQGGYETALKVVQPDLVFMLPVENRWALRSIVSRYNVKLLAITDTEIWPGLITALKDKIPLMLLNGRVSNKTFRRYMSLNFIFTPLLQSFSAILTKGEMEAERFIRLSGNKEKVFTGGNIKYVFDVTEPKADIISVFTGKIFLAASTHAPEEEIILDAVKKSSAVFDKIIIIPRHIKRADHIVELARKLRMDAGKLSKSSAHTVVVVDSFGLLETFYRIATKIFVGGSIAPVGGHNIFEALKYRRKVAVGPNMQNFVDITTLGEKYGLVHRVKNAQELACWAVTPEPEADFKEFYDELDKLQQDRFDKVLECIKRCIGY